MSEQQDPLADFSGVARLFPLPNLVLFPHVLQPLHIFEPRYREMTRDALDGDHLIAMALLQPDWEDKYLSKPPIYPLVCVCKIVAEQALEDGRFNILIRGLARARVVDEVESDRLYRQARVELLADALLEIATVGQARDVVRAAGRPELAVGALQDIQRALGPQRHLDPRQQLARVERFPDVVDRAELESAHPVDNL